MKIGQIDFINHLNRSSELVKHWPEWKKELADRVFLKPEFLHVTPEVQANPFVQSFTKTVEMTAPCDVRRGEPVFVGFDRGVGPDKTVVTIQNGEAAGVFNPRRMFELVPARPFEPEGVQDGDIVRENSTGEPEKQEALHPSEVNHESISATMGRGFPCYAGVPEPVLTKAKEIPTPSVCITHSDRCEWEEATRFEMPSKKPEPVESVNPFEL